MGSGDKSRKQDVKPDRLSSSKQKDTVKRYRNLLVMNSLVEI